MKKDSISSAFYGKKEIERLIIADLASQGYKIVNELEYRTSHQVVSIPGITTNTILTDFEGASVLVQHNHYDATAKLKAGISEFAAAVAKGINDEPFR